MTFAPRLNYEVYDAAVEKALVKRPEKSIEVKYEQHAAYYYARSDARRSLMSKASSQLERKMEMIKLRDQVVRTYLALDQQHRSDREGNED